MGVIGLKRQAGCWEFFSEFRPEHRERLRSITVLRAIKESMKLVRECQASVISFVEDEPEGDRLLKRLGFQRIHGGYLWPS